MVTLLIKKLFKNIKIVFIDSENIDKYLRPRKTRKVLEPSVSFGKVSAKIGEYESEETESYFRMVEDYIRGAWDYLIVYVSDPLLLGFRHERRLKDKIKPFRDVKADQWLLADFKPGDFVIFFGTIKRVGSNFYLLNKFDILSKIAQQKRVSFFNVYKIFNLAECASTVIPSYKVVFSLDKVRDHFKFEKLENAFVFSRVLGSNNKYSRKLLQGSLIEIEVMCVFVSREIDEVREKIESKLTKSFAGSATFPLFKLNSVDHISKEKLIEDFGKAQSSQHGVFISAILGVNQRILAGDKLWPLLGTPLYKFSDETSPEQVENVVSTLQEICRKILVNINMLSVCLMHSNLFSYKEISEACRNAIRVSFSKFIYRGHVQAFMKTTYGCEGSTKVAFILTDRSIEPYVADIPDSEYDKIHGRPHNMPKYIVSQKDREAIRPWILKYVIPQNIFRLIEEDEITLSDFDVEWYNAD